MAVCLYSSSTTLVLFKYITLNGYCFDFLRLLQYFLIVTLSRDY